MTELLMIIFAVVSDLPIDIIFVSFLVFIFKFLFASAVFRKQYIILSFPFFIRLYSSTKAHSDIFTGCMFLYLIWTYMTFFYFLGIVIQNYVEERWVQHTTCLKHSLDINSLAEAHFGIRPHQCSDADKDKEMKKIK